MRVHLPLLFALLASTIPASARAQQLTLLADGGQRREVFGSGYRASGKYGGFAGSVAITGFNEEDFSVVIPISAEVRFSDYGVNDGRASGDVMLRDGNISYGIGMDL